MKKPYIFPANRQLISEDMRIDELPAIKIWGRRCSDGRGGWFYFSAVEFFEPGAGGEMRSGEGEEPPVGV